MAWARALFAGDVLAEAERAELLTPAVLPDGTNTGYGLGIGIGENESGPVYAHSGGIPAYNSEFAYVPGWSLATAALVNTWDGAHAVM